MNQDDDPVRWTATGSVDASGALNLTLHGAISSGWHIGPVPPRARPDEMASVTRCSVPGWMLTAIDDEPGPDELTDPFTGSTTLAYLGEATLRLTLRRNGEISNSHELPPHVEVSQQACSDTSCLPPETIVVPIEGARTSGG